MHKLGWQSSEELCPASSYALSQVLHICRNLVLIAARPLMLQGLAPSLSVSMLCLKVRATTAAAWCSLTGQWKSQVKAAKL